MRLSDWPVVEALVAARNHLIRQRDYGPISVVVGGFHQSAELVDHVAPAIRLELRHQILDLERRLQALGVTID